MRIKILKCNLKDFRKNEEFTDWLHRKQPIKQMETWEDN